MESVRTMWESLLYARGLRSNLSWWGEQLGRCASGTRGYVAMLRRMLGAATLNIGVYEEIEADRSANLQALGVVVLVSLATGIGYLSTGGVSGLIRAIIFGIIGWGLWALITYWIGTTLFRTRETEANWGQLLRTMGFAQSPGILRVFLFIPFIGPYIFYAVSFWQIVTVVVAVRQALDYRSTLRAVGVVVVAYIPHILLLVLLLALYD